MKNWLFILSLFLSSAAAAQIQPQLLRGEWALYKEFSDSSGVWIPLASQIIRISIQDKTVKIPQKTYSHWQLQDSTLTWIDLCYRVIYLSENALVWEILHGDTVGRLQGLFRPNMGTAKIGATEIDAVSALQTGSNRLKKANFPSLVTTQAEHSDTTEEEIYRIVVHRPTFPGCENFYQAKEKIWQCSDSMMFRFIYANLEYPPAAKKKKIEGTVILSFTVEKDGSPKSPEIIQDIGEGCGEEVLRVFAKMPKWNPGPARGRPVRFHINLPVKFKLD